MSEPTEAQIDVAYDVLREELVMPHSVDVWDYLIPDMSDETSKEAVRSLQAADDKAERKNRDLIRRALTAALNEEGGE